jgi:death-on-curing family protein
MLGAAYVEHIHDALVSKLWPGGDPIIDGEYRSTELIESAVARPFHSAFGQDAYPTFIEKGIALFHSLIANHPFYNGNKRTAVIAVDHFFLANGYVLFLLNAQMYDLAEQTASYRKRGVSHEQSLREITEVIAANIVSLDTLRVEKKKNPKLAKPYEVLLRIRQVVRRNPLNKLIRPSS